MSSEALARTALKLLTIVCKTHGDLREHHRAEARERRASARRRRGRGVHAGHVLRNGCVVPADGPPSHTRGVRAPDGLPGQPYPPVRMEGKERGRKVPGRSEVQSVRQFHVCELHGMDRPSDRGVQRMKPINRFRKTTRRLAVHYRVWLADARWYPALNLIVVTWRRIKP